MSTNKLKDKLDKHKEQMNIRRSNSLKTDFVAESLKHLHLCMDIQK
jgi:hypothetical protein